MRLFVKGLDGVTVAVDVGRSGGSSSSEGSSGAAAAAAGAAAAAAVPAGTLEELMSAVEARLGVPAEDQVLTTLGGRPLRPLVVTAAGGGSDGGGAAVGAPGHGAGGGGSGGGDGGGGGRGGDLAACWGLQPHDTLQLSVRLRGGQPVKVKVLTPTPKVECGAQVTVDLEPDTPLRAVKAQLAAATGLPVGRCRVLLGAIGSLVLIDKSSNIGASYCGSTNNLYFATLPATEAPREPPAKADAASAK